MNSIDIRLIQAYCKQRDEAVIQAVKYGNLEAFKRFCDSNTNKKHLIKDEILIISAHKMCCNITTMPKDLQKKVRKMAYRTWLRRSYVLRRS